MTKVTEQLNTAETTVNPQININMANWFMAIICVLLFYGALMVFSAGAAVDQHIDMSKFWQYTTIKRIIFVPIAIFLIAIIAQFNWTRILFFKKYFWLSPIVFLLGISIGLLCYVLVFGKSVNFSRRWIEVGSFLRFQPSEIAKWVTLLFMAGFCDHQGKQMKSFARGFLPAFGILLVVVGLVGKEDLGTGLLIAMMGMLVMIFGGIKKRFLFILLPLAVIGYFVFIHNVPYRRARVEAFLSGGQRAASVNYHKEQSLMAIASGGFIGCGLGNGVIKMGHLPEDTTDFIFAVIGEELGFVGCLAAILLYVALMLCAVVIICNCHRRIDQLLVLAIAGAIGTQALINMFVVTGMAPTKGIALPFISAGGTGLLITAMAVGVLISTAKNSAKSEFD
ncbi:MAG: FtsW/RodA/SpoVE family cell cycle protein [Phycisphaerae bacterium]|nr:FtsW/RodA/SpoVE family cell cycle protein [Phycisphaerae bacterium]